MLTRSRSVRLPEGEKRSHSTCRKTTCFRTEQATSVLEHDIRQHIEAYQEYMLRDRIELTLGYRNSLELSTPSCISRDNKLASQTLGISKTYLGWPYRMHMCVTRGNFWFLVHFVGRSLPDLHVESSIFCTAVSCSGVQFLAGVN